MSRNVEKIFHSTTILKPYFQWLCQCIH